MINRYMTGEPFPPMRRGGLVCPVCGTLRQAPPSDTLTDPNAVAPGPRCDNPNGCRAALIWEKEYDAMQFLPRLQSLWPADLSELPTV